jgi:RNA polymerase sigma-70 factor, ECF subfamily
MSVMSKSTVWPEIESVYRSRFAEFVRVARAVTGDPDLALEAVQKGFADALRNAGQWKGRGPLEAWVWRCVVNRARKARPPAATEISGDAGPNGHDDGSDTELRVRLAALPERQRLIVFLRYFADLEYQEIASTLRIEVGTVSATLHAAHAALRVGLEEVRA